MDIVCVRINTCTVLSVRLPLIAASRVSMGHAKFVGGSYSPHQGGGGRFSFLPTWAKILAGIDVPYQCKVDEKIGRSP